MGKTATMKMYGFFYSAKTKPDPKKHHFYPDQTLEGNLLVKVEHVCKQLISNKKSICYFNTALCYISIKMCFVGITDLKTQIAVMFIVSC